VASNGSLIAVGATHDLNSDVGSVFLYDQAGAAVSRIDNPAPIANDHFGWSLAMTSTHILVGAPHDDGDPATGISDEGSAYLYNTAGNLLQTFRNPVPRIGSGYGWAVAFLENAPGSGSLAAGTYALVSGNDVDQAGARSGAVYMYDLATGNLVTTMASQAGDALGYDVAGIPGTNLVVSAGINEDSIETNSGAGYLFHAESGNILLKFKKAAPGHFDFFGHTIAPLVDGSGQVLFGVEEDDTGSQDTGAVYKFAIPEPATLLLLGVGGLTLLHRRRAA
ncbi:MAG: FG-GAP repeat protein, partial [Pirellulaceae bacterium]|nr:FG-GAP repeat protein [Pirellulaceae bacterium]